jgi:hypothetical protein
MNKFFKKYNFSFFFLTLIMILFSVSFSFAQAKGLIPDCNTKMGPNGFTDPCGFGQMMALVNTVINFLLIDMVMPLSAIIFAYCGWLFMTSGENAGKRTQAKGILLNVVVGLCIALASWLIVKFILVGIGYNTTLFDSFYS